MTGIMNKARPVLAEELESFCARWSGRTGISVEIWALPSAPAPAPLGQGVLTVVREALANVERHSGASAVSLAVTSGAKGLRLTISDNGRGFGAVEPGGGMARMRAALAELGGRLSAHGVSGEGTTVSGIIPGSHSFGLSE
jgi:signal transduction histidine kinase